MQFHIAKPENDEGHFWKIKREDARFLEGRDGDSLLQPFQCDLCWFRNLHKGDPIPHHPKDDALLIHIRRVNLDLLWSRAPKTVQNYLSTYRKSVAMDEELGLTTSHPHPGPWPLRDDVGFQVALQIVCASKLQGSNVLDYQQFDTIRRIRTMYQHLFERSSLAADNYWVLKKSNRGDVLHTSQCPTNSLFFTRFIEGLLKRMNKMVRSDLALDPRILHIIMNNMEKEIRSQRTTLKRKRWLIIAGTYFIISFVCSLRGNKGFMIDAGSLIKYIVKGKEHDDVPHVVIPLLGRFKNEIGERFHLMFSVNQTKSGFNVRWWVELLVSTLKLEKKRDGPAICDEEGFVIKSSYMNEEFHKQLLKVQESHPGLIDPTLIVEDEYNIRRSFRRGSVTTARENGVSKDTVDMINRWSKTEYKGGRRGGSMRDYYTEMRMILKRILIYSSKL